MFSICQEIVAQGELDKSLAAQRDAESKFTREIGVLDRRFYQCIQQPHVIWAATEWTSESAHNTAAEGIMEVRSDDRVASAYFRPGLYFEIFGRPLDEGTRQFSDAEATAGLVLVCHGQLADRAQEGWAARLSERFGALAAPNGLLRVTTFENIYARSEFVGFVEWRDEPAYAAGRMIDGRTVEERLYVEDGRSDLAAYTQYECTRLDMTATVPPGSL